VHCAPRECSGGGQPTFDVRGQQQVGNRAPDPRRALPGRQRFGQAFEAILAGLEDTGEP